MRTKAFAATLSACFAALPVTSPAATAPNEENCSRAISDGLEMLRRPPPGRTPRDEEDRKQLLAEMQRLVDDSRRQGKSECQSWTQLMGKAFNQ
jgi:hypothetical protein